MPVLSNFASPDIYSVVYIRKIKEFNCEYFKVKKKGQSAVLTMNI